MAAELETYKAMSVPDSTTGAGGGAIDENFRFTADSLSNASVYKRSEFGTIVNYHPTADTDVARGIALLAAIAAAVAGDMVYLSSGTFAVGSSQIVPVASTSWRGSGLDRTIISTTKGAGLTTAFITPPAGLLVQDLTILDQNATQGAVPLIGYGSGDAAPSNDRDSAIRLINVRLEGFQDCLFFNQLSGTVFFQAFNCVFSSGFDCLNSVKAAASIVELFGCDIDSDASRSSIVSNARCANNEGSGAVVRLYSCRVSAVGEQFGLAIGVQCGAGTLEMHGGSIVTSGASDPDFDALQSGSGNLTLSGVSHDTSKTTGTITYPLVMSSGDSEISGIKSFTDGIAFPFPSAQSLLAAGQIVPSEGVVQVVGNGGAVTLTSNPQVTAGSDGQVLIISGTDDTNTVTLQDGRGVHLHEVAMLGDHDYLQLVYHEPDSQWEELSRNFASSDKTWSFRSKTGAGGTAYIGGFYNFAASANDFNPAVTHGMADTSYAAHFLLVQAAGGGGGTDTVIRITGTSVDELGNHTASDTKDITVDNAGAAGTYYETETKWLGQVSIEKLSGPDILCNYGYCKYWDNNNSAFRLVGFDGTWVGAANDNAPDIKVYHHKSAGWTYAAGAAPTPPPPVISMNTDHGTDIKFKAGEEGAWKRTNLNTVVNGDGTEGTIIEIVTTASNSLTIGNFLLKIRPR